MSQLGVGTQPDRRLGAWSQPSLARLDASVYCASRMAWAEFTSQVEETKVDMTSVAVPASRAAVLWRIHWFAHCLVLVLVLHAGCGPSDVERTLECLNADGTHRAVLWFRGGGGAAGWSFTSVSVIPASASSADVSVLEQGTVFDAAHAVNMLLRWRQTGELEIEYAKAVSVHRALVRIGRS